MKYKVKINQKIIFHQNTFFNSKFQIVYIEPALKIKKGRV